VPYLSACELVIHYEEAQHYIKCMHHYLHLTTTTTTH